MLAEFIDKRSKSCCEGCEVVVAWLELSSRASIGARWTTVAGWLAKEVLCLDHLAPMKPEPPLMSEVLYLDALIPGSSGCAAPVAGFEKQSLACGAGVSSKVACSGVAMGARLADVSSKVACCGEVAKVVEIGHLHGVSGIEEGKTNETDVCADADAVLEELRHSGGEEEVCSGVSSEDEEKKKETEECAGGGLEDLGIIADLVHDLLAQFNDNTGESWP